MKRKVLYMLVSLVIAFSLWAYVVTIVSPESEATFYNVPVVLNNETVLNEKGLMNITQKPPTLTLVLSGNRRDLSKLKSSVITVLADLARINEEGTQNLNYSISFPGEIAMNILEQSPAYITLDIAEWSSKDVDVTVKYTGSVPSDYIVDKESALLDYKKVTLTGPKNVLDQITQAVVEVDLNNRTGIISESYRYTLCNGEGQPVDVSQVKSNVAEVYLTLKIQRVKEVTLLLDVIYGGGATAETTTIKLDPATIKISGSENLLDDLDTLVVGSVDVSELTSSTQRTFPINLPEGVRNLTGVTEVTVTIRFPDLAVKTLSVYTIEAINVPEGMAADIATKICEVTVRGTKRQIALITETNLRILVDLSVPQEGEGLYEAQIVVDDAFNTVGIVGNYNISVLLTPIIEEPAEF